MTYYNNKMILITGAASGIGKSLSLQLARRNPQRMILVDINLNGLQELSKIIQKEGILPDLFQIDLSSRDETQNFFNDVIEKYPSIDMVFNNAGISLFGEFQDLNEKDLEQYINTNLWSVVHGTHIIYKHMVQNHIKGHIINTSSLGGLIPQPLSSLYSATKHAITGLSTSLANEARAHDIQISVVCPGFIKTPIHDNFPIIGHFNRQKVTRLIQKQKGITADLCAARILKKVSRQKVLITTDSFGTFIWGLYRLFPALFTHSPKKIFTKMINGLKE